MRIFKIIFLSFIVVSCSDKEDDIFINNLFSYLNDQSVEFEAVIACAANDKITNDVLVFYYPEEGSKDIRIYETVNLDVDKNDYSMYKRIDIPSEPIFNGYLEKFSKTFGRENWIIITYELENEIKVSNPIRLKHLSQPSVWNNEVNINQSQSTMPIFNWTANTSGESAIYFQIISDSENNLLSGTYTYENHFKYYDTSNVVLNITLETPPTLSIGATYNFTLMDVSLDNWVNTIIEKSFIAE